MSAKYYDRIILDDGVVVFFAELRAFQRLGRRIAELESEYDERIIAHWGTIDAMNEEVMRAEELQERILKNVQEEVGRLRQMGLEVDHGIEEATEEGQAWLINDHKSNDEPDMRCNVPEVVEPIIAPDGQIVVDCGEMSRITKNQEEAFDWLFVQQEIVCQQVKRAIYDFYSTHILPQYREMPRFQGEWHDRVLPKIVKGDELDDCVVLVRVYLDPELSRIGLEFRCTWDREHGLGVLLENKQVTAVGYSDILY